jgi:DNA-binding beta-propeller fold protein YncE
MWGYFGTAETPDAFWGPRDVAVDQNGNVYITDTGNKRIVIFDEDGNYINQFGTQGFGLGEFDEPVGLTIDRVGRRLYLADTWNQRVQVFGEAADGTLSAALMEYSFYGWFGQSLDNKPYLNMGKNGDVFVVDPEGYRVIQFSPDGVFKRAWGQYSLDIDGFNLAAGVAVDGEGRVWVSDAGNNRLLRFVLPE